MWEKFSLKKKEHFVPKELSASEYRTNLSAINDACAIKLSGKYNDCAKIEHAKAYFTYICFIVLWNGR